MSSYPNRFKLRPISAALLAALTVPAMPGYAADAPAPAAGNVLPEVQVQAQGEQSYKTDAVASPKFTAPLLDTPQTVTVIPKKVFTEQGAQTLSDALRNTPGITMLAGEGGGASNTAGDSFFMRGFDATNSIFLDNIRDTGLVSRDVFNIEQIEVFKGPSAENGRNASAGYINQVSKVPLMQNAVSGTVSYGTADPSKYDLTNQFRTTLDWNQAVGASAAFRINVMAQDGGVPGRDFVERDSWGIAPSLAFGLGTPTRVYLYMQHIQQNNIPDYGLPAAALPGLSLTGAQPPQGSIDRENFYGTVHDFEDVRGDMYTARVEHDFGSGTTLQNLTRYGKNSRYAVITAPGAYDAGTQSFARNHQINDRENQILTNQTNVTAELGSGFVKHSVSGGLEFIREIQTSLQHVSAGTVPNADAFNPDPNVPVTGYNPALTGGVSEGRTDTVALYAFDNIRFGDRWRVNGGARWEYYRTEFYNNTVAPTVDLTTSDSLLSWKLGGVYKPASNGSVYLAYSNTFLPPGGANFTLSAAANNVNNPNLDPQEATNLELGTKWDLMDAKLSATAAIFHSVNTNVLVTDSVTSEVTQTGEQTVDGIELGLVGQLTNQWQVFGGVTYMNTEFAESTNAAQQGAALQWTPKLAATLWTTYVPTPGLTFGGGVRYVDTVPRQTSINQGTAPEIPSYWVFDAMVAYEVVKQATLRLNLYNLTDEFYAASLNNNGQRFNPGAPRSAMLSVDFKL